MILYLLVNDNQTTPEGAPGLFLPFKDKWRLFHSKEACLQAAVKLGWEDFMGMGTDPRVGFKNQYACGDVDLSIIAIEVEDEPHQSECPPDHHGALPAGNRRRPPRTQRHRGGAGAAAR